MTVQQVPILGREAALDETLRLIDQVRAFEPVRRISADEAARLRDLIDRGQQGAQS